MRIKSRLNKSRSGISPVYFIVLLVSWTLRHGKAKGAGVYGVGSARNAAANQRSPYLLPRLMVRGRLLRSVVPRDTLRF